MAFEEIARLLPEKPSPGFESWALSACEDQLGGEYTVFRRESLSTADLCQELITPEDRAAAENRRKRTWGAVCTCSACGEDWVAGWHREGKIKGISALVGEDGYMYEGIPHVGSLDEWQVVCWAEGEKVYCPLCGSDTRLVHKSSLRQGRTYAAMAAEVERVENYTVLLYWLIRRRWDEYGLRHTEIRPREAVVIDEKGRLIRFSHAKYTDVGESLAPAWAHRNFRDPENIPFYSHGGGMGGTCRNTIGAFWWLLMPDMQGSTGEKTGLPEFVRELCGSPVVYLKLWKKHPAVENLIKAGWARTIAREIQRQEAAQTGYMRSVSAEIEWLDFEKVAPHKILNMSRPEVKQAARYNWEREELRLWLDYSEVYGKKARRPEWLHAMMKKYDPRKLNYIFAMECDGWEACDLHKVCSYLDKQEGIIPHTAAQIFIDYRRMLDEQLRGQDPSPAQLWPPNLRAAHDGLAASIKIDTDPKRAKKFRELKEQYAALEWTDGEYCIIVPESNAELVAEGKTLEHCVGRYGQQHCEGQPIFFVRKYRRPERSFYTLNENLKGKEPYRVQLHGYKNEYIKGKNRSIPPKVRAFVERWEKEVLLPWFRETQAYRAKNKEIRRINVA